MRGPTTDHDEIRRWAQAQNAVPAEVIPYLFDSQPAIVRFMVGQVPANQSELREISWESFFATFDLLELALVYDGGGNYELLQKAERTQGVLQGRAI